MFTARGFHEELNLPDILGQYLPEVNVSKPVVEELEEVGEDPRKSQNSNMIRQRSSKYIVE